MRNDDSKARPLVLLFYDGFERKAAPGLAGAAYSHARRFARLAYRTALRKQPRTGFYTWFLMLRRALERVGCRVLVNDFAAAVRAPEHPIGIAGFPSVLDKVANLPNPRLLGPGLYSSPLENPALFDDPRNRLMLHTCDWIAAVFEPYQRGRIRPWFGGFDVADFPDARQLPKRWDVLIYDKIYFDRDEVYERTIGPFMRMLEARGLSYKVLRYGQHHYSDYLASLRASRCMAFFAHSETQGMAYQECLASNVPIFAWDEGIWANPMAGDLGRGPIACTSVPYFDERCGRRFKIADMQEAWDGFYAALDTYEPRRFIADVLTLEKSAELYLAAYGETAPGVTPGAAYAAS